MAPLLIFVAGLVMWGAERRWPRQALVRTRFWWPRTVALNALQAGAVYGCGAAFDPWLREHAILSLRGWQDGAAIGLGYISITLVYYVWHRARHKNAALWRWVHQLHHSPARMEVWTSFYKHPFEFVLNGLLSSVVVYVALGLSPTQATTVTLLCGLAELFYHWNIKTPHVLGYFIQRPEMHLVHHQRGRHCMNYGDLPVWDMLFGTFYNPRHADIVCGFPPDKEQRFGEMLRGRDVHASAARGAVHKVPAAAWIIGAVGLLHPVAQVCGLTPLAQLSAATLTSPAPRVFTVHRGVETFSQRYHLRYESAAGDVNHVIGPEDFERMQGPYNRKNVVGALLSYAPAYGDQPAFTQMMQPVARAMLCPGDGLLDELTLPPRRSGTPFRIEAWSKGEVVPHVLEVSCP